MPAPLARITAGISGSSSRGGRNSTSMPCAIMLSTSETCLAAEPPASVTMRSQPHSSAVASKLAVWAMRQGLLLSLCAKPTE